MPVTLRVVGVYLNAPINVPADKIATFNVADLLEEARSKGLLNYRLEMNGSIGIIEREVPRKIRATKGGKERYPGHYAIDEIRTEASSPAPGTLVDRSNPTSRVQAWQYYIERPFKLAVPADIGDEKIETGYVNISATKPITPAERAARIASGESAGFDVPEKSQILQDGDIVTLRCVVILTGPSGRRI